MTARRFVLAAATAAAFAAPAAAQWGNIVGAVTLAEKETPPAPATLTVPATHVDFAYCTAKGSPPDEKLIVDPKSRGVKNVFVYLKAVAPGDIHPSYPQDKDAVAKADDAAFLKDNGVAWADVEAAAAAGKADVAKLKAGAVLDQVSCVFVPRALCFREGQKLLVKNPETVSHNTNVQGFAAKNSFNLTMPPKTVLVKELEKESGVISVQCNVHGWMQMYMMVLDHPYFAVTDASGAFKLTNVKAGKYKLMVRNSDGLMFVKGGLNVVVEEGKDAAMPVAVDLPKK